MDFYICEINGKQYKVLPGIPLLVDLVDKEVVAKVLSATRDGKIEVGQPYLKDELNFKILGEVKKPKIRVAKFHAKANYRRVKGQRTKRTKIMFEAVKK